MRHARHPSPWASALVVAAALNAGVCSATSIHRRALEVPDEFDNGWEYQGCYVDVFRTLSRATRVDAQMTNEQCVEFCFDQGFPYAGTEYHTECFCGDSLAPGGVEAPEADCSTPCGGAPGEACGGPGRLTVYWTSELTVVEPVVNPGVDGWSSLGCYAEGTSGRALTYGLNTVPGGEMTIAKCTAGCRNAGFRLAGAEYAAECFCGNTVANGGMPATSGCNMLCAGNSTEYCGGPNRLNVYEFEAISPTTTTTTVDTLETATSATPTPTPQPTELPDGWSSYGCWIDGRDGRILNYQAPDDPALTLEKCVQKCADRGNTVAGAQYYTQCFCGDMVVNGGEEATSNSQCSTPCGGNTDQYCGGPDRMSLFSIGEPRVAGVPTVVEAVGEWVYQGCARDNLGDARTFPWQLIFENTMTPSDCLDACAEFGYMAAGLEYGQECYCGDPANIEAAGSEFVADTQCDIPCAGDPSAICGGGSRLTTYFWDGEPFYSWGFPEAGSPEAGSYDFLIGGTSIPLMTSQAINGKVTFLEKWGTGPANSTGAYELDLSVIDDFQAAWRTMHVRTDIFCAAGVTLPDRAGRQLTVGGWSGDSTYGVRLYTPDGSPGVHGTNDWEENVALLSLQDGRWYPSTLNMANGSILVIGGEEGSNGAPVPTLEILPYTGTAPLYMDWLERTDPNNLYPFVAVLPSGGIFVAYWNEARILDENTFETIRMLPNIPGAVNDPLGGRTYPLEGTAVLLPQRAPYTEPLGVLICGGSTEGTANALDNCVSTQPDLAEPEWVIERMPSPRVISCMAPLPDGTFLIINGAQHGVAGFGLAIEPNLNALIYDPAKPLHHRITVMANTTVARMYHSEAITLLDGRVLVSGSDPQDGVNPQEYRVETFTPPYLLNGLPRPTFEMENTDWAFGEEVTFTLGAAARNGAITASLLGSVSSTHGNSMGARTLLPDVECSGTSCTVTAPPDAYISPPGWYQFFVLDGGVPAVGVFVRVGGDPAQLGNWPEGEGFTRPGL
ncbi:hypothetical protein S7711_02276 [Stachybotrys chartarum IBT 7711]|uniref:WSC domain-containing protein n=1 Tax=Stachybotrys chartarum (strain CBS 109288 / IBT 7711) TaxID=1280523 RepID=A0A084AZE8_STACB|nr:hypothetical protein S7711_02276 [Stachybotrys chartarum IBT 7711]